MFLVLKVVDLAFESIFCICGCVFSICCFLFGILRKVDCDAPLASEEIKNI